MVEAELPDSMYVERDEERQRYLEFLAQDTPWVLLFTGMGGSGKTDFLGDLESYTPDTCKLVRLNFETKAQRIDALTVLREIAGQIKSFCDRQSFNEFKAALLSGREVLASKNTQIIQQLVQGDYAQGQDIRLDLTIEANSAEIRHQVRSEVVEAFYSLLETFRLPQLVIILDSWEWLDEKEGQEVGEWLKNELLPHMHTLFKDKHYRCSVVIATSLPISFANIPPGARQECNLDRLAETAVDAYLQRLGIQEPLLRKHIYHSITYGHASCVHLLARIWFDEKSKRSDEEPFSLAQLAKLHATFKQRAWEAFFYDHVLKKFEHSPFEELVHYGVLLRSFDLPLLQAVFSRSLPKSVAAVYRFRELIRYPYIRKYSATHYAFIDLMREILTEYIRHQEPEEWQNYHRLAKQELQSKAIPDWHYHDLSYNEQQGMREWKRAVDEAYSNATRERLKALLEAANDKTLELATASCAERAYEQGRYYAFCHQEKRALASYKQALSLFQSIHDAAGEAKAQQAIDRIQQGEEATGEP